MLHSFFLVECMDTMIHRAYFFFHIIEGKLHILPMWYTLIIWDYFVVCCMTSTSLVICFTRIHLSLLYFFCKKCLSHFCNLTSINIYKIEYVWLIVDFYMLYYISFITSTIFHLITIFFLNFNILFLKSIPLLYLMLKKNANLSLYSLTNICLYISLMVAKASTSQLHQTTQLTQCSASR